MAKTPRIAVVGSANIDLTTFCDRFPKPGETIFGQKFDLGFGGKGANQAVAAKFCGANVFMVARVGSDLFGPATIENFKKLGIDATHVKQVEGVSSGVAPIFVEPNGQNRIFVVKGANDELKPADVDAAADLLRAVDCIVLQFEIPLETVYYTVVFARESGIRCILNPAPGQPIDIKAVSGLDYFVPNESEAEAITGMPVKNVEDAKKCAEKLLGYGIRRVIITLGANGSLLAGKEGMEHLPAFPVRVSTAPAPATPSSAALPCFSVKGFPSVKLFAAPICTRDFQPPVWGRRSPSTIGRPLTPNGPSATSPESDPPLQTYAEGFHPRRDLSAAYYGCFGAAKENQNHCRPGQRRPSRYKFPVTADAAPAPQIDLLGITTVSGDQWMEPATVFALWSVEQAQRSDVPVIKGAEMPLLNTPREQELREALYGSYTGWHGSFNPDAHGPKPTWAWLPQNETQARSRRRLYR